jgi:uncharacterized protein YeaO (DUF488 family)
MIKTKRIYEAESKDDGYRILIDRLWPRGLNKEKAGVDLWFKEIAPSSDLRKWYKHDPEKWDEFRKRYKDELESKQDLLKEIKNLSKEKSTLTLLFSSKEEKLNNAAALKEILDNED